ncbi:MAG: guanylate kinase [Candidatus Komeilibacteria bacterium CG10_big_fil_rev_8_21_14_0_10_41_13]|uniref:Guanylate kinase n=1 Tax=Candidatus Komeilibacteria bacterium CG10_big_fil_rev_8_21_14_0_10_41_13 TaxID=1974476 RepID=A0A2M6WD58_9BACT|nr:MAG: guanylate kinase [Candidatus Komeilibacteria bacterium CG10_big_fil_rev_8_21_14_0_10_41_13]
MKPGKLFLITGASAVGKSTIAKAVLVKAKNLKKSITYTTREKRKGEKNHLHYHFITESEFKNKIKKKEFFEYANNYGSWYGTDRQDIQMALKKGQNVLIVIDIKGALAIKKIWPTKTKVIFILPENTKQLEKRLKQRKNTTKAGTKKRLETAEWELKQAPKCDFWVINKENKVAEAVKEVLEIIKAG